MTNQDLTNSFDLLFFIP